MHIAPFFQQQPLNPSSHKASEHLTGAPPGQLGCCRWYPFLSCDPLKQQTPCFSSHSKARLIFRCGVIRELKTVWDEPLPSVNCKQCAGGLSVHRGAADVYRGLARPPSPQSSTGSHPGRCRRKLGRLWNLHLSIFYPTEFYRRWLLKVLLVL